MWFDSDRNEPIWPSVRKIELSISVVVESSRLVGDDIAFEKVETEELVELELIEISIFCLVEGIIVFINECVCTGGQKAIQELRKLLKTIFGNKLTFMMRGKLFVIEKADL